MNLNFPISATSVGAEVTRLELDKSKELLTSSPTGTGSRTARLVTRHASRVTRHAFTLIEILVVMVLLSFIVIALMAVFNGTQTAFRASLTQTDVLEGGRTAMALLKSDLEGMTPSFGVSNGAVNFCVYTNDWQYQSGSAPLVQSLLGANTQRTNVLEKFFILTRQNTTWTGVGYVVDTTSTNYFNPLYRFSMSTNVQAANVPAILYTNFLDNTVLPISTTNLGKLNLSHLMDGVVDLRVRAYDLNGVWMTNGYIYLTNLTAKNVQFDPSTLDEVGFIMFSNTVPASVEINLGVLEDRAIQRAQSLADNPTAQLAYLSNHVNQVHVFRQRVWIRNVDPSAYQP